MKLVKIRQIYGRFRMAGNFLLQRQAVDRAVTTFDDDWWFVSYPRSGNTYWRFLTANLISNGETVDWTNIERLVPDIYVTFDPQLKQARRPRYIKSHEGYKPSYRRVVMIVRDPRDVAVSCFYFAKKIDTLPPGATMDWFVDELIAGRRYDFGNWSENVGSWLGARQGTPDFAVFRYEDMLSDTFGQLTRLAEILKIPASPEKIRLAIENSQADKLRALEKPQKNSHKFLRYSRSDVPYVRSASANQWQEALSPRAVQAIETAYGRLMREFGYLS